MHFVKVAITGFTLMSVRYYDTGGRLVQEYLEAPVVLPPLASADFLVESRDMAGGVGANFLVDWSAEEPAHDPLIEAVMVGVAGNHAISFVSSGRPMDGASESE